MTARPVELEEQRLSAVGSLEEYGAFHERHRVFPAVFEDRAHRRIIDLSAGVGAVARNLRRDYGAQLLCNDISPKCLSLLGSLGLKTISFDLDDVEAPFPLPDGGFDAVISLATIEHLIHIDHFLEETRRILSPGGSFYLSSPNYSGLLYLVPFVLSGRTFHDPLRPESRYEFLGHVRYLTYRTLREYVESKGFLLDTVYLPLPEASTKYRHLRERSRLEAAAFRLAMRLMYTFLSPRWASEPVLCFRKVEAGTVGKRPRIRRVVL